MLHFWTEQIISDVDTTKTLTNQSREQGHASLGQKAKRVPSQTVSERYIICPFSSCGEYLLWLQGIQGQYIYYKLGVYDVIFSCTLQLRCARVRQLSFAHNAFSDRLPRLASVLEIYRLPLRLQKLLLQVPTPLLFTQIAHKNDLAGSTDREAPEIILFFFSHIKIQGIRLLLFFFFVIVGLFHYLQQSVYTYLYCFFKNYAIKLILILRHVTG